MKKTISKRPKKYVKHKPNIFRTIRLEMKMSQIDFAKFVSVSANSISQWEENKRFPIGHHLDIYFDLVATQEEFSEMKFLLKQLESIKNEDKKKKNEQKKKRREKEKN